MRRIGYICLLLAVSLTGCESAPKQKPGEYQSKIVHAASMQVTNAVLVTPDARPNGQCANCRGTGILGDGTIKITCPVCKGSGKSVVSLVSTTKGVGCQCQMKCGRTNCPCIKENGGKNVLGTDGESIINPCSGPERHDGSVLAIRTNTRKPVAASGGCANGQCQLPANTTKKTTVAAPQRSGSCSGGSCGVRSRGRLFGRWR